MDFCLFIGHPRACTYARARVHLLCFFMSASVFHFKQFTVNQDKCAMKVGTDGVLLGAWAQVGDASRILDIGTGTGLLALMLAQRSTAYIDAIDIDGQSCEQAAENSMSSPWADRIRIVHSSLMDFEPGERYDLIISNPPYFIDNMAASDEARNLARSASASLTPIELINGVLRLLSREGRFCLILPHREGQLFREQAEQSGLFCISITEVRTGADKPVKRLMMEYSRSEGELHTDELLIQVDQRNYTDAYKALTAAYYPSF